MNTDGPVTGAWRLYDFFLSLHIMDWKNHEDFNTPWLLAFAVSGHCFAMREGARTVGAGVVTSITE